jgi:hypothetical protein
VALVFVFEEHERVVPILALDATNPRQQFGGAVVRSPQPQIAPIGGGDEGRVEIVVRFGQAQCGAVVVQQCEDFLVEPRRMSELKGEALRRRQQCQKSRSRGKSFLKFGGN